jgi:hypothetical protein
VDTTLDDTLDDGCRAAISWSAGKDSFLALLRARETALQVQTSQVRRLAPVFSRILLGRHVLAALGVGAV